MGQIVDVKTFEKKYKIWNKHDINKTGTSILNWSILHSESKNWTILFLQ